MTQRLFRFSTQTGHSVTNAAKALDAALPFTSPLVQAALAGSGLPLVAEGYAWAFKPNMTVTEPPGRAMRPGDVALRVTKDPAGTRVIESLYEVLGFFPANPALVTAGLGIVWAGPGPWPNSTLFGTRTVLPAPVPYDPLATGYGWPAGAMMRAAWLETGGASVADWLATNLLTAGPTTGPSPGIGIKKAKPPLAKRPRTTRPGNAAFKVAVFGAYRNTAGALSCAACDLTNEDLLDGAHIVDFGWADEVWSNGLPLCANHHRAFDRYLIRLNPTTTAWEIGPTFGGTLADLKVTRPDLSHLPRAPHNDALDWKY